MKSHSRKSALLLFASAVVLSLPASIVAQQVRPQLASASVPAHVRVANASAGRALPFKRVALRMADAPGGSRVLISSDAALDGFKTYAEGERFYVLIPHADAPVEAASRLSGRGFDGVRSEQQGDDALLTFKLQPGIAARARANFNRLELTFAPQEQDKSNGTGGESNATPKSNEPATATPTPTPATTPTTPATTTPTNEPTASSSATPPPAAAPVAGSSAARFAALLTPEKANPVGVRRFEQAPVIDGKLDDEVWKTAAVFKNFIQNRPGDLIPPSQQTEAYLGYDSKFLYVAFRAYDEPGKVRATIAKRDAVFDDDWVGVFLDTFDDKRKAYELIFNPLGVQADAIFSEGINEDFSVDIVMDSKGSITPDGYVVEVAIPFKSLRYTAGKDKQWGIHFLRTIKRFNNEQSSWMPISRDNSSLLGQAGRITGLEGISTERTIELIPSLTISETGRRVRTITPGQRAAAREAGLRLPSDPGRFLNKPVEFDPGLTAKFGITPTMTLDFTYNPDFAQVEADATVVTANQRFPIFFEEKRPFFLEGKEIFETIISAVHTRAIVDPEYAAKLTGKQGRTSFGLLLASDIAPGNLSDDDRDFIRDERNDPFERASLSKVLDKHATIGVLRLKRDVGKENHIGLIATSYNFVDNYNQMGGVDARFRFNKTTTFTAQVLGSVTHKPFFYAQEGLTDDRKEKGMAYAYNLNMSGRNWGYELAGVGRSKFFRANVGFNRRFDTNSPSLFVRYQSNDKPKATLVRWRAYNFMSANFDWRGRSQRSVNESQLQLNFQKQTYLGMGFEKGYERVFEEEFGISRNAPCANDPDPDNRCGSAFSGAPERSARRTTVYLFGGTTPSKKYSAYFFTSYNRGVLDFDFGTSSRRFRRVSPVALEFGQDAPLDPGPGVEWFLEAGATYKPTDALRLSLDYTKDRLSRYDTGRTAFDDNIFSLRSTYQFTRFTFARARLDYSTLSSNVRGQFLLGWAPNPGTSFYVGYNDDLNRHGFHPFNGELEPGFRRNGRTFFIKMSYLIRRSFGS